MSNEDSSSSSCTEQENLDPLDNTSTNTTPATTTTSTTASINYKDKSQDELNQLLLQSSIQKDVDGIKLALEHGANASFTIGSTSFWGATSPAYGPIHKVLEWKVLNWDDTEPDDYETKYSTLELLLSKGAKVDDQAFEKVLRDDNFVNLFLFYGADPDTCFHSERRSMRYYGHASIPILHRVLENYDLDILETFLKYKVNVNALSTDKGKSDYDDITDTIEAPLHIVCKNFRGFNNPDESDLELNDILTKMVLLLLKRNANVNIYGQKVIEIPNEKYLIFNLKIKNIYTRYTPLHLAIQRQNEELYNILLLNGANSYLNYYKNNQHIPTSELLKEFNLNWKLYFEWTPKNHKKLPIELKNRIKTLQYCASHLNWSLSSDILSNIYTFICLDYIVVKHKEMNRQYLNTLLYEYSINKDLIGIKLVLELGANPSINKQVDHLGNCTLHGPIHIILQWVGEDEKRFSALELLLSKGANIFARYNSRYDEKGKTAFEMALALNDLKLISLFLYYGGDPNTLMVRKAHTMRYDGHSSHPYIYETIMYGRLQLFKCLLQYNVNVNVNASNSGQSEYGERTYTNETPLHLACKLFKQNLNEYNEYKEMILLLLQNNAIINSFGKCINHIPNEEYKEPPTDLDVNSEEYYQIVNPRGSKFIPKMKNIYIRYTPLHLAIRNQNEELYNILLCNGANSKLNFEEDDQEVTTSELLQKYNLNWKLEFEWSIQYHKYLPIELKNRIKTLQYCASYLNWPLNIDTLSIIYTFTCLDYFYTKNSNV